MNAQGEHLHTSENPFVNMTLSLFSENRLSAIPFELRLDFTPNTPTYSVNLSDIPPEAKYVSLAIHLKQDAEDYPDGEITTTISTGKKGALFWEDGKLKCCQAKLDLPLGLKVQSQTGHSYDIDLRKTFVESEKEGEIESIPEEDFSGGMELFLYSSRTDPLTTTSAIDSFDPKRFDYDVAISPKDAEQTKYGLLRTKAIESGLRMEFDHSHCEKEDTLSWRESDFVSFAQFPILQDAEGKQVFTARVKNGGTLLGEYRFNIKSLEEENPEPNLGNNFGENYAEEEVGEITKDEEEKIDLPSFEHLKDNSLVLKSENINLFDIDFEPAVEYQLVKRDKTKSDSGEYLLKIDPTQHRRLNGVVTLRVRSKADPLEECHHVFKMKWPGKDYAKADLEKLLEKLDEEEKGEKGETETFEMEAYKEENLSEGNVTNNSQQLEKIVEETPPPYSKEDPVKYHTEPTSPLYAELPPTYTPHPQHYPVTHVYPVRVHYDPNCPLLEKTHPKVMTLNLAEMPKNLRRRRDLMAFNLTIIFVLLLTLYFLI